VITRSRNLHARPEYETEPILGIFAKLDLAHHNPWRHKDLALSIVCTAVKVARVRLNFGPQVLSDLVLRRRILLDRPANRRHGTRRQHRSKRGLHIELSEALTTVGVMVDTAVPFL
jgi:hypothetical protein